MSAPPVLIEAAINGTSTKERNPHVPITPDEIRADAEAGLDAKHIVATALAALGRGVAQAPARA